MKAISANWSSGRGQAAVEYLMIAGFVMLIMLPLVYLVFNYTQDSGADIANAQVSKLGRDMVNNAESVFYFSEPSKITLDASMPAGVRNISIVQNIAKSGCTECTELRFDIQQRDNVATLAFSTPIELRTEMYDIETKTSTFPEEAYSPGIKHFKIEAKKDHVLISVGR